MRVKHSGLSTNFWISPLYSADTYALNFYLASRNDKVRVLSSMGRVSTNLGLDRSVIPNTNMKRIQNTQAEYTP